MKMKTTINTAISVLAVTLLSAEVKGETAADIGTLPSQKVPAPVVEGDRNPFATRIPQKEEGFGNIDAESEESRIRQIFANLQVNGYVPGSTGSARVLVGDLILREGIDVPQVIENQTDVLRVTRISKKEVEITWIDEEVAEAPRKLLIPINLEPEVSFVLPGRGPSPSNQFVTMSNDEGPGEKPQAGAEGEAQSGQDIDPSEKDDLREEAQERQTQPKRVSPFGLFRRQ